MATFTISQLTAKPSGYTMVDSDIFVMTTGTTTPLLSTVKTNLADIRTFYETAGNEIRGSAWTVTNSNSANWGQAYLSTSTDLKNNSASWNSSYSTINSNSARYTQTAVSLETNVQPYSANWNNVFTDYKAVSAEFLYGTTSILSAWPSSSSVYSFAHGLVTRPAFVRGVAVCTTGEHGYSVGDEIDIASITSEYGTAVVRPAVMLVTGTTNVSAIFAKASDDAGNSHSGYLIPNAGITGSPDETLTPGNWNVKIYASHTPVA